MPGLSSKLSRSIMYDKITAYNVQYISEII